MHYSGGTCQKARPSALRKTAVTAAKPKTCTPQTHNSQHPAHTEQRCGKRARRTFGRSRMRYGFGGLSSGCSPRPCAVNAVRTRSFSSSRCLFAAAARACISAIAGGSSSEFCTRRHARDCRCACAHCGAELVVHGVSGLGARQSCSAAAHIIINVHRRIQVRHITSLALVTWLCKCALLGAAAEDNSLMQIGIAT